MNYREFTVFHDIALHEDEDYAKGYAALRAYLERELPTVAVQIARFEAEAKEAQRMMDEETYRAQLDAAYTQNVVEVCRLEALKAGRRVTLWTLAIIGLVLTFDALVAYLIYGLVT